ncbi:pentapeptide repeat-containing protein [Phytomonospora sp. NPDC050363]|uniref:pentapeptide repeat-containing protein n=1 Tax=Phytomonospora sp. NPDC050363 TaxID=3155642 RepID=UPI0033D5920A
MPPPPIETRETRTGRNKLKDAWFSGARFAWDARFSGARFLGPAGFRRAELAGCARSAGRGSQH